MVNPQLVSYIKRQLSQGYRIGSIKVNLARTGYTSVQINAAVEAAYGKPTRHLAKILLLVGGGAVILAALITALILLLGGAREVQPASQLPTKDVGLSLSLDKTTLEPGEDLKFNLRLVNLGSGSNFGIEVRNEVYDQAELVASKDDVITLGLQESQDYEIELDLPEGRYQLKTIIEYSGKKKQETANFRISQEPVADDVVIEDLGELTGESVRAIEDIKAVAETEPSRARSLCLGLTTTLEKDTCLLQTGLKINDQSFCPGISDNDKKDSCYVNVALALKEYSLCNQVVNQNLKDACLALGG